MLRLRNLVHTMLEEMELFGVTPESATPSSVDRAEKSDVRVFIVHGHDEAAKSKVARFVEKLGMSAVILHERADRGKTIIEKFEHEAKEVSFAIVLLTADDTAKVKNSNSKPTSRARQNVVFELGYFVGTLGRSNVVALREPGVEMPSDYAGVIYIDLDNSDSWRLALAKEMKHAGIKIDLNQAL